MPHIRADAPARAFAVLAEFDRWDGDAELLVRLVQSGYGVDSMQALRKRWSALAPVRLIAVSAT